MGDVEKGSSSRRDGGRTFGVAFRGLRWSPQAICGWLTCCGKKKKKMEWILSDITGYFAPGTLTALMGSSGSGKSSLLDILSKRKTQGTIEGDIFYDEQPLTGAFARDHVGYVEQSPSLIANLTAEELLLYTAALQRPASEDPSARKAEVARLMEKLGLLGRKDVVVGGALTKGLSGGETKRVTIAIGMIRDPAVLFLDEPTSGLDSATANGIMKLVKGIAEEGRTVASAIHSPTAYCFGLFDRLLLLSGGRVSFLGEASGAVAFLTRAGISADEDYTASEWLVEILARPETLGRIAEVYSGSDLCRGNAVRVERLLSSDPPEREGALEAKSATQPQRWSPLREITALFRYRTPRNFTDGAYLGARVGDKILFMLVIISLYYGKGTPKGGSDLASSASAFSTVVPSVLFMVTVLPAFGAAGYMPSLMMERPIFVRERADGNYRVPSYLVYKVLEEFVVTVPISLLFCVAVYYGVGMQGDLGLFWLIFLVTQNIGIVLAYLVAAFAPSVDSANAILPCYVTICLFFVGLLIPYSEIPVYWQWFSYITFLKYSWSALMLNEFQGNQPGMLSIFSLNKDDSKWAYFGYLCAFYPAFFLGALLIMSYSKYVKR